MQQFLVIFREPDGRTQPHSPEELRQHRLDWQSWMAKTSAAGHPLSLTGRVIRPIPNPAKVHAQQISGRAIPNPCVESNPPLPYTNTHGLQLRVTDGPHTPSTSKHQTPENSIPITDLSNDREIIGGYLFINADNLDHATSLMLDCPIFNAGSYAEIREFMQQPQLPQQPQQLQQSQPPQPPQQPQQPQQLQQLQQSQQPQPLQPLQPLQQPQQPQQLQQPQPPQQPQQLQPPQQPQQSQQPLQSQQPQASQQTSLSRQNKDTVLRFNISFIQDGDAATSFDILDPAVVNHTAPPGVPANADGMRQVINAFRSAMPDLRVEILRQIAEDDIVVTHKRFHATFSHPLMGIPPTGRPVTIPVIDIVRLRNGKYIEHWGLRDMSDLYLK